MKVAGQDLQVLVRAAGAQAFLITVGDAEPVQVVREDTPGRAATRWSWSAGAKRVHAKAAGHGNELVVGLRGLDLPVNVQDGRAALLASLSLALPKGPQGPVRLRTQIPGRVVKVLVAVGDAVQEGQPLVVVEAMKMENETRAPRAGTVDEINVEPGATIEAGACLVVLRPTP